MSIICHFKLKKHRGLGDVSQKLYNFAVRINQLIIKVKTLQNGKNSYYGRDYAAPFHSRKQQICTS